MVVGYVPRSAISPCFSVCRRLLFTANQDRVASCQAITLPCLSSQNSFFCHGSYGGIRIAATRICPHNNLRPFSSSSASPSTKSISKSKPSGAYPGVRWMSRYAELVDFQKEHGHCRVPQKYPANQGLANFVTTQRTQYRYYQQGKKSNMNITRMELLEDINFQWTINGWTEEWDRRFEELREYRREHGDCNVPRGWKTNPPLAHWVNTQRQQNQLLQSNQPSLMTEERVQKLDSIGFEWKILGPYENKKSWDGRLEELKAYKEEYGNCNVPLKWEGNRQLANWVNRQREYYRSFLEKGESHTNMTQEKIDKLEEVGFEWFPKDAVWMEKFVQLQRYREEHGDCCVPIRGEYPSLGRWVATQRQHYKRRLQGKKSWMTPQRIDLLNSIGFDWDPRRLGIKED